MHVRIVLHNRSWTRARGEKDLGKENLLFRLFQDMPREKKSYKGLDQRVASRSTWSWVEQLYRKNCKKGHTRSFPDTAVIFQDIHSGTRKIDKSWHSREKSFYSVFSSMHRCLGIHSSVKANPVRAPIKRKVGEASLICLSLINWFQMNGASKRKVIEDFSLQNVTICLLCKLQERLFEYLINIGIFLCVKVKPETSRSRKLVVVDGIIITFCVYDMRILIERRN